MRSPYVRARRLLAAAVLSLFVTSCDDGGLGILFAFFGVVNGGDCDGITVEVNLTEAGATVAQAEGAIECALDAARQIDGCEIQADVFIDKGGDEILVVTVDQCIVPGISNLFDCGFSVGDTAALENATSASCNCVAPRSSVGFCSPSPFVCASNQSGCALSETTTTSTTSTTLEPDTTTTTTTSTTLEPDTTTTTTTTSTTTSTTTTTTLGGGPQFLCLGILEVPETESLGSLQFDVDYSGTTADPVGSGSAVECDSLVSGGIAEFNDNEKSDVLTAGIIALAGFDTPADVAQCQFAASSPAPTGMDFGITVVDAVDPTFTPVSVTVQFRSFVCEAGSTTTTTTMGDDTTTSTSSTSSSSTSSTSTSTTTTTTLPGSTTTTTLGVTTTTMDTGGVPYVVTFSVPESLSGVGAVQFDVDYASAPGSFDLAGNGVDPACTTTGNVGGFGAFSDTPGTSTLTGGVISLAGFNTPASVATCNFTAVGGVPTGGDFVATVTDASFGNLDPISPLPTVAAAVAPARR